MKEFMASFEAVGLHYPCTDGKFSSSAGIFGGFDGTK
jgi:hypothetical protein